MGKIATFFGAARTDEASKEYSDSVYIGNILAECGYTEVMEDWWKLSR